jgi:hypothetical protein
MDNSLYTLLHHNEDLFQCNKFKKVQSRTSDVVDEFYYLVLICSMETGHYDTRK